MRSLKHVVYFATFLFCCVQAQRASDVTVDINEDTYMMRVSSQGELNWLDFNGNEDDTYLVRVQSDTRVRCFFWYEKETDVNYQRGRDFISHAFGNGRLQKPHTKPERLYCYDNTVEDENTFAIYLENKRGQREIVHLHLEPGEESAELDLYRRNQKLSVGVERIAMITSPTGRGVECEIFNDRPKRNFEINEYTAWTLPTTYESAQDCLPSADQAVFKG